MNRVLDLLGRVFISTIFLFSGLNKIEKYEETIEWMASYNLPNYLLAPTIVLEIIAPILIIIGYKTKIAAAALSIFCIATAIVFYNNFDNQMQLTAFLKNIALSGGFLFLVINGAKGFCLDKK